MIEDVVRVVMAADRERACSRVDGENARGPAARVVTTLFLAADLNSFAHVGDAA